MSLTMPTHTLLQQTSHVLAVVIVYLGLDI